MNMKKRDIIVCLLAVLALAVFAGCASTRSHESAGEYVDDSVITAKVKSQLAADNLLGSFEIGVETYRGVVQLSGFVNSQEAIDKAGQITMSVKGVNKVINNLVVK